MKKRLVEWIVLFVLALLTIGGTGWIAVWNRANTIERHIDDRIDTLREQVLLFRDYQDRVADLEQTSGALARSVKNLQTMNTQGEVQKLILESALTRDRQLTIEVLRDILREARSQTVPPIPTSD